MILDGARARIADLRAVLALRPFLIYQIGAVGMTVGFWMQRVAVGWLVWQMTGSEAWLGLVAFAELFPSIFTGLLGGSLADRSSAPRVLFWGNLGLFGAAVVMFVMSVAGALDPLSVLALMVWIGAVSGLILPARLAMASYLAPAALLPSALAVNSTGFNLSRFIGPALAGGVIVAGSVPVVFGLAALGYAAFSWSLFRIRNTPPQRAWVPRRAGDNGSSWAVIRTLPETPVIFAVIALQFALGVLVRPASELFPAFAEAVFGRGAVGLGLLNAALGLGAVFGALALSRSREGPAALRQIFATSIVFAVSIMAFVATGAFWFALLLLVVHGVAMTSSNIAALAYVQINTPSDRLGRVLSIYAIVFRAGPALGAFLFGLAAEGFGLMPTGLAFGAAGLVTIVAIGSHVLAHYRRDGLG